MTLGNTISFYRKKNNITQEALAQQLNVTNQAVSKWELDQCCPDIQLLPRLADIFQISMDELFGREAKKQERILVNGLPWADDDKTVHAVLYVGHTLVGHRKMGWKHDRLPMAKEITLVYDGPALDVDSDFSVKCGAVSGNVDAGGSVTCSGDVGGDVDAGGNVTCGGVGGDVDAGGNVTCGEVTGDVDAGGSVACGDIGGSVDAGGSVVIKK